MFNKKLSQEDVNKIVELIDMSMAVVLDEVDRKIDKLTKGIDFNGNIAGEIMEFLLEKSGFTFFQELEDFTEKELKLLGDHKEFELNGRKFLIAKKSNIEKINKKDKKVNKK